jgi:predicted transcriptional regulator
MLKLDEIVRDCDTRIKKHEQRIQREEQEKVILLSFKSLSLCIKLLIEHTLKLLIIVLCTDQK